MEAIDTVDDMLINSIGMEDLGNIDIDKYQKGIFSPSPKSNIVSQPSAAVTSYVLSPHKPQSPHVVPSFSQGSPHPIVQPISPRLVSTTANVTIASQIPLSPRMTPVPTSSVPIPQIQQQIPSQQHSGQMQRKVQLGPNFDRLGILNQANEAPPMNTPFFAKALQQHGGSTLGAILQAHQHAMQQQMQRENFLLQQAAQHQQMFQTMPMHNVYQQQRFHQMMLERRTDDQIVPNPQLQAEHWLHAQGNPPAQKQARIKREEDIEISSGRSSVASNNETKPRDHYVIFNDEHHNENMTDDEDEEKSKSRIRPPKNSQFVRYQPESNRSLPSFSESFSGHIDKLKLKEEQLRQMLLRHQMQCGQMQMQQRMQCTPVGMGTSNVFLQQLQAQQQQQQLHHQQQLLLRQQQYQTHQPKPRKQPKQRHNSNHEHKVVEAKKQTVGKLIEAKINTKTAMESENNTCEDEQETKSTIDDTNYNHLDFLNDVRKDANDLLSCFENTKNLDSEEKNGAETALPNTQKISDSTQESIKNTEDINIFPSDLDLSNEHNYDNLFNGNSDEHCFHSGHLINANCFL